MRFKIKLRNYTDIKTLKHLKDEGRKGKKGEKEKERKKYCERKGKVERGKNKWQVGSDGVRLTEQGETSPRNMRT